MQKWLFLILVWFGQAQAAEPIQLRVAQLGPADYRSIQQAINQLPANDQWGIIRIGPGVYPEKIYLTRDRVVLAGAGKDQTIIQVAELRANWLAQHPTDWGSAVVNINATDIALVQLTVRNHYGALTGDHRHQFAIRGFERASRIITADCAVLADGADTLSLWNKTDGMYYHHQCRFEGHTDMVCPRGWAFFSQSHFINHRRSATLWHDGELDSQQKLVVRDSVFEGIDGFLLGRRHYDAQFYLIHNEYSNNMADRAIFRVNYPDEPGRDQANQWGDRIYISQAEGSTALYPWLTDNLATHPQQLSADDITPRWAFEGRWDPEADLAQIQHWLESEP
ncbi:pectinesterase family protein [Alkalimonas mucilaginosa]|uniref:Pectinesterase family protein n=1 Tax=Alkalimonas mucilaginosa TaxID=3057676 RepID=A0ABU7JAI1_9GAMM|nr:pectinesterase family protein [Alkalimonas sp. MEB004]MEE2022706.1 pectinesterase family protein [Alkalimonas sp. MEB004]